MTEKKPQSVKQEDFKEVEEKPVAIPAPNSKNKELRRLLEKQANALAELDQDSDKK